MVGIYAITNKINKKVYIGQSWDIRTRFRDYKSYRSNDHLYYSFKKYGIENFHFGIITLFPKNVKQKTLDYWEDSYIIAADTMNDAKGYNKRRGGSHGRHGVESKRKLSEIQKGRKLSKAHKKAIGESCKGTVHSKESVRRGVETRRANGGYFVSDETREKMRQSHLGKKQSRESIEKMLAWRKRNYVISEETKRKISESNKGKKRTPEQRQRMRESALRRHAKETN